MSPRVLVVTTRTAFAEPLSVALRASDLDYVGARTLRAAVDATVTEELPSAVVVDLMCVPGDLAPLCDAVRAHEQGGGVPIIFCGTGGEAIKSTSDALIVGGDGYIAVPAEAQRVVAKLATYIGCPVPELPASLVLPGAESPPESHESVSDVPEDFPAAAPAPAESSTGEPITEQLYAYPGGVASVAGGVPTVSSGDPVSAMTGEVNVSVEGASGVDAIVDEVMRKEQVRGQAGSDMLDVTTPVRAPAFVTGVPRKAETQEQDVILPAGGTLPTVPPDVSGLDDPTSIPDGVAVSSAEASLDAGGDAPAGPNDAHSEKTSEGDPVSEDVFSEDIEAQRAILEAKARANAEAEEARRTAGERAAELERLRAEAEAEVRRVAEERARLEEIEAARKKAEERAATREAEERARIEAIEAQRRAAEEDSQRALEAAARKEAEERDRLAAIEDRRRIAEENARAAADESARRTAEERARLEELEQRRRDAEERARRVAEDAARREGEELARLEDLERQRADAEQQAQRAAEEVARREAEERARLEELEQKRTEAEQHAQRAAEEAARREAEERARLEELERERIEAEERAQRSFEEAARKESRERARLEEIQEQRAVAEESALRAREEAARREAEELRRIEELEQKRAEAEELAERAFEESVRREAEERARLQALAEQRAAAEADAQRALEETEQRMQSELAALDDLTRRREQAEREAEVAIADAQRSSEAALKQLEETQAREAEERARVAAVEAARRTAEAEAEHARNVAIAEEARLKALLDDLDRHKRALEEEARARFADRMRREAEEIERIKQLEQERVRAEEEARRADDERRARERDEESRLADIAQRRARADEELRATVAERARAIAEQEERVAEIRAARVAAEEAERRAVEERMRAAAEAEERLAEAQRARALVEAEAKDELERLKQVRAEEELAQRELEERRARARLAFQSGRLDAVPQGENVAGADIGAQRRPITDAEGNVIGYGLLPIIPAEVEPPPPVAFASLEPEAGRFSDGELPAVLWAANALRVTGAIDLVAEDGRTRTLFLEEGEPVLVESALPQDRPEEGMLRAGLVTAALYNELRAGPLRSPRRTASLLVAEGHLKTDELFPAVRGALVEQTLGLLEWDSGTFQYREARAHAADRIRLEHEMGALLAEGVRRKFDERRLWSVLGGPATLLGPDNRGRRLPPLSPEEKLALARIDGTRALEDIIVETTLSAVVVLRASLIAVSCGAARVLARGMPSDANDRGAQRERSLAIDRARVLDRLHAARHGDYFTFLGVDMHASPFEVHRAAERVRQRFDPARFTDPAYADLKAALDEILEVSVDAEAVLADEALADGYRRNILTSVGVRKKRAG